MERPGYEDTSEDIFGAVFTDDIGKKRCSSKHDAKDEEELKNLNVIVQNEKELPVEDDEPQDIVSIIWNMFDEWTAVYRARVQRRRNLLLSFLLAILALLYLIGLLYAAVRNLEDASVMLVLTGLVFCVAVYYILKDKFGEAIWKNIFEKPFYIFYDLDSKFKWFLFLIFAVIVFGIAVYLCRHNLYQLSSGAGLIGFMFIMFIFSKHPRKVKWRPVLWGVALQFVFGLIILRTEIGYNIFRWLGDLTQTFLDFSEAGAKFLFGDPEYLDHFFAFKVLPILIYFSSFISILYHWGIMQIFIKKIAWLMQKTMQTSASESLNAAGNIFVGQTEAPLLIRPMLKDMTKSEIHAVMTGGFATIAGAIVGAYISFGISASHLISACVMSAPAALAISKLFYPETEISKHVDIDKIELPKGEQRNVIEAASHGAKISIPLALNIAGNLIAFLSLLALLNGIIRYLGGLLGSDELSFELICSYIFIPVAFLMGVEPKDCRIVAELVGLKTFLNEFVAYQKLSEYIKNRELETGEYLTIRSEIIATYALCGFSNISAIGVQIGALSAMAPSRASDFASVAIRALIAGSVACFMTACIAGVLYDESKYDGSTVIQVNETFLT